MSKVIWLGDESTYEQITSESGPVLQILTKEGEEAIENGEELRQWTTEEWKRYVVKEVTLAELLQVYNEQCDNWFD